MRKNPHVRICGGLGSATTLVYPTLSSRTASSGSMAHPLRPRAPRRSTGGLRVAPRRYNRLHGLIPRPVGASDSRKRKRDPGLSGFPNAILGPFGVLRG